MKKIVKKTVVAKPKAKPAPKKVASKTVKKPVKKVISKSKPAVSVSKKSVKGKVVPKAVAKKVSLKPVKGKKVLPTKVIKAQLKPTPKVVEKKKATVPIVFAKQQPGKKTAPAPVKKKEEEIPVVKPKPTVRYSDADLEAFRVRIVEMRLDALDELRMLKERLDDLTSYDFAEESMIYSMHMAEQGSEAIEKEKTYAQIQRINEYLKKLDDALARIKDKSYGICRKCACLIAKERLWAVPITTLSASYKIHNRCPEDGVDRIEPFKE
jgi:RNA polymerase-binding transcription factor DksA